MSTIIDKLNDEAFNDYQSRDAGNPQNPADARCNQVNRDMNTETAPEQVHTHQQNRAGNKFNGGHTNPS